MKTTTCRYICTVRMHEKKPQKPPEHASEHVKSQNFRGACPHKLWAPLFIFALGPLNPVGSPASSELIKGIYNQKTARKWNSVVKSARNGALLYECFLVQKNREMANIVSIEACYSQTQKQSCTLHPAGDLMPLLLTYSASITETKLIAHCAVLM